MGLGKLPLFITSSDRSEIQHGYLIGPCSDGNRIFITTGGLLRDQLLIDESILSNGKNINKLKASGNCQHKWQTDLSPTSEHL